MKRDLWFAEDIEQVLAGVANSTYEALAVAQATVHNPADRETLQCFQAGFIACLTSLSLAFGLLEMPSFSPHADRSPMLRVDARGPGPRSPLDQALEAFR